MKLEKKIGKILSEFITDNRDRFLKVITGNEPSNTFPVEVYFTSAVPGESKGGHYHREAREWFTLIKGKAILQLQDISSREYLELYLDAAQPETIFVPAEVAHRFVNNSRE